MPSLFDMFQDLERQTAPERREKYLRAPFNYPGSKSASVSKILPHLPYRDSYIEPFGGSAAILLSRQESAIEVFNDRYAGVVALYRCLRDRVKMEALCDWLDLTIHSREDFIWCRDTWQDVSGDVERAGRWLYLVQYSFAGLCRNFGRSTSSTRQAGKLRNKVKILPEIHERMKHVQVENQDWQQCIEDYDNDNAVFYIDPPYIDSQQGAYAHTMSHEDHRRLLEVIFRSAGFFAVSGYPNQLYDGYQWDGRLTWEVPALAIRAFCKENAKEHKKNDTVQAKETEVLWIRESR